MLRRQLQEAGITPWPQRTQKAEQSMPRQSFHLTGKVARGVPSQVNSEEPIRLVVFGSINVDMTAVTQCQWPRENSTSSGRFCQSPGGKGANEAVAVARLGLHTALVGRLGDDEQGRVYREYLEKQHLDLSGVRGGSEVHEGEGGVRTGTAVQITTEGVKFTVSCAEANEAVDQVEVKQAVRLLEAAKRALSPPALASSGPLASVGPPPPPRWPMLLVQLEVTTAPVIDAIQAAKSMGVPVAFKPSPLSSSGMQAKVEDARRILDTGAVSLCFVN